MGLLSESALLSDRAVAVPARRTDLAGLAPAWLGVGTLDLFCAEDLAYAARLNAAGVECEVHEVPGAFHGFDGLAPKAAVSQAYFDSTCASLRRARCPPHSPVSRATCARPLPT